jgi:5-methylcytosine-specific restriction endonuclease McrA
MVFVLDKRKKPLMPCSEKRARLLLARRRAVVHRRVPFVIRLRDRTQGDSALQPIVLKIDPGARTTGLALVREAESEDEAVSPASRTCATTTEAPVVGPVQQALHRAELTHRGEQVHVRLLARRQARRRRRSAHTRYRKPRFLNRRRPQGWLAPSLRSRVDNIVSWAERYRRWTPIARVDVERVRFDTQKLQDPEISGVAYQQGALAGYEVREYVLAKWSHRCAYCGATQVPLQVEHLVPRARHGSDRVSNLTLACASCNQAKGTRTATEFGFPHLMVQARQSLAPAAAINSTRLALGQQLTQRGFVVTHWTGGRTKWNRVRLGLPKTHAYDALSLGVVGTVQTPHLPVCQMRAQGRGTRCRTKWDRYGFPRGYCLRQKRVHGFGTGDLVRVDRPTGNHIGRYTGRVAIRATGSFNVGQRQGISWRSCRLLQRADGYSYTMRLACTTDQSALPRSHSLPPVREGKDFQEDSL